MSTLPAWRLVLDTNVVLDLLHFLDARVLPIRRAIEERRAQCCASEKTLSELSRVLAYPEFQLAASARTGLMTQYQSWIDDAHNVTHACQNLPRCADPDDQIFLELAASVHADFLITRDKAVLALKRRVSGFKILTPEEAATLVNKKGG